MVSHPYLNPLTGDWSYKMVKIGDIVFTNFSFTEDINSEKLRPVLVTDISELGIATVAYCSSKNLVCLPHEALIDEKICGKVNLTKPTRIDFRKVRRIPMFDLNNGQIMGNVAVLGNDFIRALTRAINNA